MRVQDGGSPRKTAIATVRVNVARDDQSLAFRQSNYVYTIVENTPVTTNILNVEATPGVRPITVGNSVRFVSIWNIVFIILFAVSAMIAWNIYFMFCLQPDVTYRLTGFSDSGDFFSVNPNNGQITLIKDLTTDVSRRTTFYVWVKMISFTIC